MFLTALVIKAKSWKLSKCPSAGKRIPVVLSYHGVLLGGQSNHLSTEALDHPDEPQRHYAEQETRPQRLMTQLT